MFSGFDLKIDKSFFEEQGYYSYEKYLEKGKEHLNEQKLKKEIERIILDKEIDGTKLQEDWFPTVKADVFISHSHKDHELAEALVGWIDEIFDKKIKCFIDADVWGYQENLLRELNDRLSGKKIYSDRISYDYSSCNEVAQNVNIMLSIALQKMIDKTEAVIFLNTENSVKDVDDERQGRTYSPWLYTEIVCSQLIRKKPLILYRDYKRIDKSVYERAEMEFFNAVKISYSVSLQDLIEITTENLSTWKNDYLCSNEEEYPLDILYRFKIPNAVEDTKKGLFCYSLNQKNLSILKNMWFHDFAMKKISVRKSICECSEFEDICFDTNKGHCCPFLLNSNCPYNTWENLDISL